MKRENLDIQGGKPVRNDVGQLCLDDWAKQAAWKEVYDIEFEWDPHRRLSHGRSALPTPMKVLESVTENLLQQQVRIDDMQFGFMPGRSTTDAIFIVRQLQEKFCGVNNTLYMDFVDLEKAFDRVHRRVIWLTLRELGVDEWLVRPILSMYENARSRVRLGCNLSEGVINLGVNTKDEFLSINYMSC